MVKAVADRVGRAVVERVVRPQMDFLGDAAGIAVKASVTRAPGRPAGAKNRRSEDVARWVVEHLGDPLVVQAAVASMPVEALVAAGLTVKEALEERRLAAGLVLPYLHRRMPVAVDVTSQRLVHLTIVDAAPVAAEVDLSHIVDVLENQRVSDDDPEEV